jgi:antitoxin (DNA-binding transcriptional repressor) of toxin-antitoxin stability system
MSFAQILKRVDKMSQTVVVMRYGEPVAAIVPVTRLTHEEQRELSSKRQA